jgi:GTPase SAR1 family protein
MAALELSANLRLRVNMMGFERQGKTSFVRALFGEALPRDCDRTVGVEIRHMSDVDRGVSSTGAKLPPCEVTLFDFGGHVEYYSLQRSFLVHDCVHVVTVNLADITSSDVVVRERALRGVRWWLEALCARDVGGVVALLGTHLDEVSVVEGL